MRCGLRMAVACLLVHVFLWIRPCAAFPTPLITVQPTNVSVPLSGTATFSVSAESQTLMTYQWYMNGSPIFLAIFSSLTIQPVTSANAGTYYVVINNAGGSTTSSNAILSVLTPPVIATQPQSQTVGQGTNASFSVVATGSAPLNYQWQFGGKAISGATTSALTITSAQAANAGSYTVVVTNSAGSVSSQAATLTVDNPPAISTQPQKQAVVQGQNASFSVVVNGTAPFSYQWSLNGAALSGATASVLTLTGVHTSNAGSYTVAVANSWGSTTSAVATLSVYLPPSITTQPQSETVVQSQNVVLSVVAGGTGPLSYQWQAANTSSGGFTNLASAGQISGATSSVLQISNVNTNNGSLYQVVVANAYGSVTSSPVLLGVVPPFLVDVQFLGTSGTGWGGGSGSPQTGAAILGASGDTWNQEGLGYYIYPGTSTDLNAAPLVNSSNMASGLTLTVGSSANSVFGGHQPNSAPTDPDTTNLMSSAIEQFVLSANVDAWTFTLGGLSGYAGDPFNLVVYAAAPSPRTQTITVTGGASGGNTASALTTSSTNAKISSGAGNAFQIFTNGTLNGGNLVFTVNGGTAAADTYAAFVNGFQLQIYNAPVITGQPASQTNVAGSSVQFSVAALGGVLGYQWQTNGGSGFVNVGNGGVFSGANSNVLTIAGAPGSSAVSYQVIVTNNVGSVTSATVTLSLTPQISAQPVSQAATLGGNASFSVVADGSAPLSYQWYGQGVPLAGATNSTFSLTSVGTSNAGSYFVVVRNNYGLVTSAVATLSLYLPPSITMQPQSQTVAAGQSASFAVGATGAPPLVYLWNLDGTNLSGATNSTLTLANVRAANAGSYTVVVTNMAGLVTSAVATLTVTNPGIFLSLPGLASLNANGFSFQFSVPIGVTYIVASSSNLQNWTPIATNISLTGSVLFTDTAAVSNRNCFYQVQVQ